MDNKKIDKNKQKKIREIKMLNFYYNNTTNMFRYSLLIVLLLIFIYMIYIIIPQSTKNGVTGGALKQTNIEQADFSFVISPIGNEYSKQDAIKYTNQVVSYIDNRDNQVIYKATLDFLTSNCPINMNDNTQYLFDVLYEKVHTKEFINKLNSENTIKHSNLEFCKDKKAVSENTNFKLTELEKQKEKLEGEMQLQRKQREFDKEIYGDAYDERTGKLIYQNKNSRDAYDEAKRLEDERNTNSKYESTLREISYEQEKEKLKQEKTQ